MKWFQMPFVMGVLELASALTLLLIAWSLPGRQVVERTFGSARELARVSSQHLESLENQITSVRDGAAAAHVAMKQFAKTMANLESLRYPEITLNGITPTVKWHSFLPRGAGRQARNIENAAQAGVKQVNQLKRDLPHIRASLNEMDSILAQYSGRTGIALQYGRLLMVLVAMTIGLHGGHLAFSPVLWNWGRFKSVTP